jgi:hypothetical protein
MIDGQKIMIALISLTPCENRVLFRQATDASFSRLPRGLGSKSINLRGARPL